VVSGQLSEVAMANLPHAKSFRDLVVYEKAKELERAVYRLSLTFPKDEAYSLTSQIRRSSRSIGAQTAEAWAKRQYEKHFVSKLTDADGEQMETQHWLGTVVDCGYCSKEIVASLIEKCEEIGRLLAGMMAKAEMFCSEPSHRPLRESPAEYFVTLSTDDCSPITDH
jgi:four helix bundle protein